MATPREKQLTLLAAVLGTSVVFLDATVTGIALPAIRSDLGGGLAGQQWVTNAYLLALGSLLLIGGSLGDVFGQKRVFLARWIRLNTDVGTEREIRLFSYGTLQQPEVQRATFGRLLHGRPDTVLGFRLETLKVADPDVVAASGSDEHPILRACEDPEARVRGSVFLISSDELNAADEYEVEDYVRVEVPIASGGTAWVYVSRD